MFGRFKSEKVTYKIIEMKTGLLILLAFILSSITSVEAQERKNGKTMEKEERPCRQEIVVPTSLLRILTVRK